MAAHNGLSVTPDPGDLMPPDLHQHQAYVGYSYIYMQANMYTQKVNLKSSRNQAHLSSQHLEDGGRKTEV